MQVQFLVYGNLELFLHAFMNLCGGGKKTGEAYASNNISEKLTGGKPVRNEVTSERGYCGQYQSRER